MATKSHSAAIDSGIGIEKAEVEADLAQQKARLDNDIAKQKARLDNALAEQKARLDNALAEQKARLNNALAEQKAARDADLAEVTAENEADRASAEHFNTAVMDLAKASIDRSRSSAEFVQKAATAIFALYTGALAVAFSVTDRPLPARGILPSVFLGLAITLSTGYLAYLTRGQNTPQPKDAEGRAQAQLERTKAFLLWVQPAIITRSYWLRASVIALAVGAVVLPAAFLHPPAVFETKALPACTTGSPADAARTGCIPAWPTAPGPSAGASRDKLFAAQLDEVTNARAEVTRTPDANEGLLVGALITLGVLLVFGLPLIGAAAIKTKQKVKAQGSQGFAGLNLFKKP
jgi:hypothetical protein